MKAARAMSLGELVGGLPGLRLWGDPATVVGGVAYDSRRVRAGDLFAAIPGTRADGARFIPQALQAGAAAVLLAEMNGTLPAPAVIAPETRAALGLLAARLAGHPDHQVTLIGITGTNGKTTITYLLESILRRRAAGRG